jgi:hypothetical protein
MANTLYREFQFSWLLFGIIVPIQILITILYIYKMGDNPMPGQAYIAVTAVMVLVVLLFYGMTTTVERSRIKVSFGIGLISKTIETSRIKDVSTVKSPWYYGYGIRLIPNGWLYNVSGPHAVELRFVDKKRVIRIGTKNPVQLKSELDSRVVRNRG